jgi:hypothetical protein
LILLSRFINPGWHLGKLNGVAVDCPHHAPSTRESCPTITHPSNRTTRGFWTCRIPQRGGRIRWRTLDICNGNGNLAIENVRLTFEMRRYPQVQRISYFYQFLRRITVAAACRLLSTQSSCRFCLQSKRLYRTGIATSLDGQFNQLFGRC